MSAVALQSADTFPVSRLPLVIEQRYGRRISRRTAQVWCKEGVRGVVLRSRLIGGRRFTDRHAVEEFIAALNPQE
jgi:hypothetical protein